MIRCIQWVIIIKHLGHKSRVPRVWAAESKHLLSWAVGKDSIALPTRHHPLAMRHVLPVRIKFRVRARVGAEASRLQASLPL
jgi:hypothetical protein